MGWKGAAGYVATNKMANRSGRGQAGSLGAGKFTGMMSYTELAEKITSWNFSPRDPQLFKLLDDVSREEDEDGRGLLSCIVVHKVGDMEPGTGFYDLAVELGRSGDKLGLWVNELHKVHAAWEREKLRKGL